MNLLLVEYTALVVAHHRDRRKPHGTDARWRGYVAGPAVDVWIARLIQEILIAETAMEFGPLRSNIGRHDPAGCYRHSH